MLDARRLDSCSEARAYGISFIAGTQSGFHASAAASISAGGAGLDDLAEPGFVENDTDRLESVPSSSM